MAAGSSELIPGRHMTFSSVPGSLTSGDDFYVISSSLVRLILLFSVLCES